MAGWWVELQRITLDDPNSFFSQVGAGRCGGELSSHPLTGSVASRLANASVRWRIASMLAAGVGSGRGGGGAGAVGRREGSGGGETVRR